MKLIERYIFRRIAGLTLATLGATTVIVLTTQVLLYVNVLTDSGQAIMAFFRLAATLIPAMAIVVAPFAILIGATQVLNAMNAESELAVMESSRISHLNVARPVIVLGLLMSIASLIVANSVEPWSSRKLREIVNEARGDLFRLAIQSGSFKQLDQKLYVQIADELPGGELAGIFIADGRNPDTDLIYYATRGTIQKIKDADILFLGNGEIHRKNTADGAISIITFASYALSLSELGPSANGGVVAPKDRDTRDLLHPDANDPFQKDKPHMIRSELNRRFSEWLFPLAFGLIAVCFAGGAQTSREARLWSIGVAGLIAIAVRLAGFVATTRSGNSEIFAALVYAIPVAAIILFLWLIASGRSLKLSRSITDRVAQTADAVAGIAMRLARFGRFVGLAGARAGA
jgi:lipopolysaccharide export system permease protein